MSSDSDVEMKSALPKKITKKVQKSPSDLILKQNQETKKSITTKDMLRDALTELNTRKGVSLYAVKKFITEKYEVNPEKIKYFIKKAIKSEIENGSIIQTKGIGAAGSFKLAPKKKEEKSIKKKTEKKTTKEKSDKPKTTKKEMGKSKTKTDEKKKPVKDNTEVKKSKPMNKKEKIAKEPKTDKKKVENKTAKEKQTPAKKRAAMMKRKSIGSIIKPPKMKPKAS